MKNKINGKLQSQEQQKLIKRQSLYYKPKRYCVCSFQVSNRKTTDSQHSLYFVTTFSLFRTQTLLAKLNCYPEHIFRDEMNVTFFKIPFVQIFHPLRAFISPMFIPVPVIDLSFQWIAVLLLMMKVPFKQRRWWPEPTKKEAKWKK